MSLLSRKSFQIYFFLWAILISSSGFSAQKSKKIGKMKDSLGKSSHEIFELGAKIRSLEKKLGSQNEQYLSHLESMKKIDSLIGKIREKINENTIALNEEKSRVAAVYEESLLNELMPESETHLYKHKLLTKIIESEIKDLSKIEVRNKKLLTLLNNYENQFYEMKQNEQAIYEVIMTLENEKKSLSENYLDKVEVKNKLEQKLDIELARSKAYSRRGSRSKGVSIHGVNLQLPFEDHKSVRSSKKGVSLKYKGVKPIKATGNGKVVYLGRLAAYGNVIILDHGNEVRSVLLGDFVAKVKNGDRLNKGDLLGYTKNELGVSKSLYYEIRKKNIAQNTYKILKANKVL